MPTSAEVLKAIAGDKTRQTNIDATYAKARAGDAAAWTLLQNQAKGAATGDARDYARLKLSEITQVAPTYDPLGNARFNAGKAAGGVLKVAAPLAALAIPGLGIPASMAIAGIGTAAGQALKKEKLNIGDIAKAGIGAGVGRAVVGKPGVLNAAKGALKGTPASYTLPAAGQGVATASAGKPGALDSIMSWIGKNPLDAARIGLAGFSTLQGAKQSAAGNDAVGRALARVKEPVTPIDLQSLFPQDSPYRRRTY